jgi:hypothetical protein
MWVEIDDDKVRQVWVCDDCSKLHYCTPDTYADIGTPICTDCDINLSYLKTEVQGILDETVI